MLGLDDHASTDRASGSGSRSKRPASSIILLYGWSPDYDDPLTFADLYASWNLNNHGRYNNPELDAQVRIAQQSLDQSVRLEAFARDPAHHHRGRRDDPRVRARRHVRAGSRG